MFELQIYRTFTGKQINNDRMLWKRVISYELLSMLSNVRKPLYSIFFYIISQTYLILLYPDILISVQSRLQIMTYLS